MKFNPYYWQIYVQWAKVELVMSFKSTALCFLATFCSNDQSLLLLNQIHTWFFKIALGWEVNMCMCVFLPLKLLHM